MKRTSLASVMAFALLVVAASAAFAGSMHFTKSPTVSLGSLEIVGDLAGVGGGDGSYVTVTGTGTARVTAMCENKGGNQAPGQNPLLAEATNFDTYGPVQDNGKVHVDLAIDDPSPEDVIGSLSAKKAGCPNGNWKVVGIDPASVDWVYLRIVATSPTNPTYVLEGPCDTNLTAGTISCDLAEAS